MSRTRLTLCLLVLAGIIGPTARVSAQTSPQDSVTLTVIGFVGKARLRIGAEVVEIKPGSQAFSVPPGSEVKVLSGDITLLAQGNVIAARPGDAFRFALAQDRAFVEVVSGRLSVRKDGAAAELGPGETLTWPAPGAAPTETPVEAPAVQPPGAAPPEAAAPPAPEEAPPPLPPVQPPEAAAPPPPEEAPPEEAPPRKFLPDWLRKPAIRVQVELHPYYNLRETYDSNIYLVPPDKPDGEIVGGGVVGAWITSNNLGVKAIVPMTKRHKLEAGYDFRALTYSRAGGANNSADQAVTADYTYGGKRGVTGRLFNHYANTMDPAFSALVTRERRWQNTAGGRLDVEFSRSLYAFADGQHAVHKYLGSAMGGLLNHYEQSFGGGAGVLLGPKTKAYASYHRSIIHYSAGRSANSKGHSVDFGVEGKLTAKLKGTASVGFHSRRYDDASDVGRSTFTENERTWQTAVDLTYAVSRRTQASLQAFRRVSESIFGTNRFYEATGFNLSVMHAWQKLMAGLSGGVEVDRFPESTTAGGLTGKRRDDLYSAGVTAQYKFKEWLSTGFNYARVQRHSIFTRQFNYGVNRTSIEVRVSF
ncbi:MAG: outer membrane beta-barrel protein [Elusimicrobia bacterium]|nr:outer membrane beta-barrel protein [Elusimicrobiota bacterium]